MDRIYFQIIRYLLKNSPVNTRDVAIATDLTIYQARQRLNYLKNAGIVIQKSFGRGTANIWEICEDDAPPHEEL
ncbi:FaeA/PapI family transcriptional regulator [Escherichia coli]|uniref:FaeA/PapI family transcriptional regulator n=1 Tax=Escherichia coli TaxID=562 RepID=UPI0017F344D6|nr:hypothetical protein [Escherichia coli]